MRSGFRYLARMTALVVLLATCFHFVTGAAVSAYASLYFTRRLPDVRMFGEGRQVPVLVSSLIGSAIPQNAVVAAGSSFTFGYPYDERFAFAAELNAVNLGVVGLGLAGIHDWLICAMIARGLRARALIIEIPLVNEMSWLPHQTPENAKLNSCPSTKTESLLLFALTHPIGTGWSALLFDRYRLTVPPSRVSIAKAPAGYFASASDLRKVEGILQENIKTLYVAARMVSDNVIMFVTPIYVDGLTQADADRAAVGEQFDRAQEFCRDAAGDNCLDLSLLIRNPDNFYNLTHFNGTGAKALAALIAPKISQQQATK